MVHFEDLRETFDRMDWYLYSYSYYKLFWAILAMKLSMLFSESLCRTWRSALVHSNRTNDQSKKIKIFSVNPIENHILSPSLESPKACCDTFYSREGQRPSKYGLIPKV